MQSIQPVISTNTALFGLTATESLLATADEVIE
jgi:hypothetical protein